MTSQEMTMPIEVRLPQLSMGMSDAEIIDWQVVRGDTVAEGDDLVEVDAEKAQVMIPAPSAGTVVEIHAQPGDVVEVRGLLCVLEAA
jgi:pyruvate/2-oxoglutarate dehydrogenase complex dihydrolipoamide acyltransferase (E2) component